MQNGTKQIKQAFNQTTQIEKTRACSDEWNGHTQDSNCYINDYLPIIHYYQIYTVTKNVTWEKAGVKRVND